MIQVGLDLKSNESKITLGVLNVIHQSPEVTQRSVAKELGIALGLANSYLKRCIKKGLVKVRHAPTNRYAYYLTPQGFAEKTRLTAEYLSQGYHFFRITQTQCSEIFRICELRGWNRIALHGLTDVAEIAVLSANKHKILITGIVDETTALPAYNGAPIVRKLCDLDDFDALVVSDIGNPQARYDEIRKSVPIERILVPAILGVNTNPKHVDRIYRGAQ